MRYQMRWSWYFVGEVMVKAGSVCFECNNHQNGLCTKGHPLEPKDGKDYLIEWCADLEKRVKAGEKPKQIVEMTVDELKKEAIALHESIAIAECYGMSDLSLFDAILNELHKRGITFREVTRLEFDEPAIGEVSG